MLSKKKSPISIQIDAGLKDSAEQVLSQMGLNYTTAITLFLKAVVNEGKIPFEIKDYPFYSKVNQEELQKSINQLNNNEN